MKKHPADFFSAERTFADIKAIYGETRWLTTPRIQKAGQYIARAIKHAAGLKEIAIHNYPADGKTAYGGWIMSKAWDVKSARLEIVSPNASEPVLADYKTNPHSLINWSPPTRRGGITGEVAILEKPFEYSGSLKGKFALTASSGDMTCELIAWLAQRGAIGLLCDQMNWVKGVKEEKDLGNATQWFNYANPQWDGAPRLPAFALTPNGGRALRALAASGPVKLKATVDARLYDGEFPLVTAFLPGASHEEIVLTAHMDEPGASDNATGTAMCMELLRAMAKFCAARKKPLKRGIRFFASVEARGLQAYLNTTKYGRHVVAGLNLDMVGYDHTDGRTLLKVLAAAPHTHSYVDALLEELVVKESQVEPAFRYKIERGVAVDDTHFSSLPFSAPMCMVGQWPDRTYHTSVDFPQNMSLPHLQRMGRLFCEAVRFMADASFSEVHSFAERFYRKTIRDLRSGNASAEILENTKAIWSGLIRITPDGPACPRPDKIAEYWRKGILMGGHLYPRAVLQHLIARWSNYITANTTPLLRKAAAASSSAKPQVIAPALKKEAARLVPRKTFAGYIAFEDLNSAERERLKRETGISFSWAAPGWLQWALDLANGKRTVLEIFSELQRRGQKVDLKSLIGALKFLARRKQVFFRKYLTGRDVSAALRRLGVLQGDIVMAHTSLSDFGYIEGGAQTVIDCLLKAVGKRGTLAMPTHTLSWLGNPPYEPNRSPSLVGAITNVFLKQKGVIRSAHPTHSVALRGPKARALASGHAPGTAPMSRDGFWGNFFDANGKVVLLCKPDSNTLLHCGELWAGTPFPPTRVHFLKNGKRVEAATPSMPWHTTSFVAVHDALRRQKKMKSARLGESTIHTLRAKDGVEEMMRQVTRDPYVVMPKHCKCWWCGEVRKSLAKKR